MLHHSKRSVWRKGMLLLVAAMLVLTVAACGKNDSKTGTNSNEVIATYKDGEVTAGEFDQFLNVFALVNSGYASVISIPQYKDGLLKQYIGYKILSARATEDSRKQAEKEADTQYKQFSAGTVGEQTIAAVMKEKKISEKDVKNFFTLVLTITDSFTAAVTEDQLKKEYEATKDNYTVVTLRHILVMINDDAEKGEVRTKEQALARANEVKKLLEADKSEANWNKLAPEYSDDPGSKDKGGQYADTPAGQWTENFKKASLEQEIGVIGAPVETEYGYHVIMVEKRVQTAYDKLTEDEKLQLKSQTISGNVSSFMENELPGLITKQKSFEEEANAEAEQGAETGSDATEEAK